MYFVLLNNLIVQVVFNEANCILQFLPLDLMIEVMLGLIQRQVQALIDWLYHI
jgi:hypothetical protein